MVPDYVGMYRSLNKLPDSISIDDFKLSREKYFTVFQLVIFFISSDISAIINFTFFLSRCYNGKF